jgi:hypothetical protein
VPYVAPISSSGVLFLNKLLDTGNQSEVCSINSCTYIYVCVSRPYLLEGLLWSVKVPQTKMPNMQHITKSQRRLENKIHSPLMRMQFKHSSRLYPQFLLFSCVRLPTKNLKLVVHLVASPPVSTTDSCAKGFVSCLINGGDFTVQLFLIRPFSFVPKRF